MTPTPPRFHRYRVAALEGRTLPEGPAHVVERRSEADRQWHRASGYMTRARAEALVEHLNDPLWRVRTR